ncbi:hypothetical protein SAZ11_59810 [Streptomyces sp. FXJ1.4098]|nr:hypothetical protein [Streptomyces sp. FXJ1.4098]
MAELFREALAHHAQPPQPVAVTMHGFVADTSQKAADLYFPADARCST